MSYNKNQNISILSLINCSLFSELSKDYLNTITDLILFRNVAKGTLILSEEKKSNSIFIIQKGLVKVTKFSDKGKELILAFLGQDEFFGEMSLFDGEGRSTNIVAKSDCKVFEIRKNDFVNIVNNSTEVSMEIIKKLSSRLRKANNKIENISNHNSEYRIGVCLLDFAEDFGEIFQGEVRIKKIPTQIEISNMTGTSRETVSRVLSEFQKNGIIIKKNRELIIPNYKKFQDIFI